MDYVTQTAQLTPATAYIKYGEDGLPYLSGMRCQSCGATYLGDRQDCARCFARGSLDQVSLGTRGTLYNYTIVYRSYPGVKVPFVSAIVDLEGGGTVKGNLLDVEPDPANIRFGMPVQMVFRGADTATEAGAGFLAHFFVPAGDA